MRIRALKPGFFKNEALSDLSPWHRLCFAGLWCCADREGRLEDRPRRLKAEIFPYDVVEMDQLLGELAQAGFIRRYQVAEQRLIWIPTWEDHQHPRQDESTSVYPAYTPETTANQLSTQHVTTIGTDPSLHSDAAATSKRMGSGKWEVGDGTSGNSAAEPAPPNGPHALMDLWNRTTTEPLPRCRELTVERRRKIRARLASRPSLTDWRTVFAAVEASTFCRGQNDRGWVADFDYVIKNDTVAAKLLERAGLRPAVGARRDGVQHGSRCGHTPRCDTNAACIALALAEGRAQRQEVA